MTSPRVATLELLTTDRVLALYERHFGRLEAQTKRRIIATARERGWDRRFDDFDGLAA